MQNPFAIAVQWPDEPRSYLVHLQRPYFTAALCETPAAAWLFLTWSPGFQPDEAHRSSLFQGAAKFCREHLAQTGIRIEFVERKHGYHLPRFVMAQTASKDLFIVEPEHAAPLVEVRDNGAASRHSHTADSKLSPRFDVITQWRLGEMRKYYQQYLERQKVLGAGPKLVTA